MMFRYSPLFFFLFFLFNCLRVCCEDSTERLIKDLLIVDYWNRRLNERLPVTYNHFLQGGYLNMPSARMGKEGEIGIGYSSVPPYRNINLRCQIIDQLEVAGNYRIFKGMDDPILTPLGFGDLSDKGVSLKLSLFSPEDSDYTIPGLAIGADDILGTRNFKAKYVVLTHVFLDYHLEFSLGYGSGRLRGLFGGILWMPFRRCEGSFLQGLAFTAEYDCIPYHDETIEKHPKGRVKKTPFNFGIKYRLWDYFDFSASCIRGNAFAFSASTYYNFGYSKGFFPKIDDPLPYKSPINIEPIGKRRPEDVVVHDLLYAMRRQGFDLLQADIFYDECCQKTLRLRVVNLIYTTECRVRERLDFLLAGLIPLDIDAVRVVIEAEGFPIQEYHYPMEIVRAFSENRLGSYELNILTPLCEVTFLEDGIARPLFKQDRDLWNFEVLPRSHALFGSAKGKFKYAFGLNFAFNGYLYNDWYYSMKIGYTFISNLKKLKGIDRLNPSQLLNVRTDIVNYYCQKGLTFDELYVQRSWNLGNGLYARIAGGYFEEEYAGIANEFLYYPLYGCLAFGIEGAILKKRTTTGLGFEDKVRKLDGFIPSYHHFLGSQYFFDIYYEWREAKLDFKVMIGKFLANDKGARFEIKRYFPSGLRVSLWYTLTNGHDRINGQTYHDKGVYVSMPLDIFYTYSDRSRWGYGMSAWLRDVGVIAETGMKLYDLIRENRD